MLSCNTNKSTQNDIRNEIKKNSGIIISKFKLVKSSSESAFGDYSESYTIKLDSADFQNIIIQIKKSKYYDSNFDYNSSSVISIDKNINKRWVKMPFGYKFEYHIDKTDEMLQYEVDLSDYTIDYTYIKE
ncbi:hypothetical protein OA93_01025 [Flavobacterium sp. KMS]|uniref:hypothetical protein n=1 Tax=Flavobacterium sp. KMS TaxID=1566023 RepID=UPI00057CB060|nr:hypothetical protein [Flavobacterium sp. KMS]KIC00227.1 hypothetical protein OA93_01025 [Flavobacterium sp. KMS]